MGPVQARFGPETGTEGVNVRVTQGTRLQVKLTRHRQVDPFVPEVFTFHLGTDFEGVGPALARVGGQYGSVDVNVAVFLKNKNIHVNILN